jgi:hypothetical protein
LLSTAEDESGTGGGLEVNCHSLQWKGVIVVKQVLAR